MLSSLLFRSSTKFAPKSREQRPSLTSFVIRVAYSKGGGGGILRGLVLVSNGFQGKWREGHSRLTAYKGGTLQKYLREGGIKRTL